MYFHAAYVILWGMNKYEDLKELIEYDEYAPAEPEPEMSLDLLEWQAPDTPELLAARGEAVREFLPTLWNVMLDLRARSHNDTSLSAERKAELAGQAEVVQQIATDYFREKYGGLLDRLKAGRQRSNGS